uniref:Large ribosomal subunit protein bL21c n=1 Tax=Neoizziella asiatica TaxID=1077397 RepID=A0A1G4NWT2_9FLOR|nr:Ribosomal protein L21 [Neoizziella asiatica]SCW23095.1 Ribosomal protein L21 [Neoizziella asiatica]
MIYAILEINGKQTWVQPGNFYDIDKVSAQPGDYIRMDKILFLRNKQEILIGQPCINKVYAKGKVLKHIKGRKITVFKMKPKKNMYSKNGHRQELSRVFIESINKSH